MDVNTLGIHIGKRRKDVERHPSDLYSRVEPLIYSDLVGLSHLTVIDYRHKTVGVNQTINSSELRVRGFKIKEVFPPTLEVPSRVGFRTRGEGLRSLED
jgi:hypothetical protein